MAIKINGQDLQKRIINGSEVSKVMLNGSQIRPATVPPTNDYFCIGFGRLGGRFRLQKVGNPTPISLEYSTDKTTWTDITIGWWKEFRPWISCYIRNKSEEPTGFSTSLSDYYYFEGDGMGTIYYVSGDINTLLCKTSTTTLVSDFCFYNLFTGMYIEGVSSLKLPATTLTRYCYYEMFRLKHITEPPLLPATTLKEGCYSSMFKDCRRLTTIPRLPSTTLVDSCYENMFIGCSRIKLSETQTGEYQTPYRIPTSGTGTSGTNSMENMFSDTGGTFTGTPSINTTYYTSNTVV